MAMLTIPPIRRPPPGYRGSVQTPVGRPSPAQIVNSPIGGGSPAPINAQYPVPLGMGGPRTADGGGPFGMPLPPGGSFSMNDMFGNTRTRGRTNTRQTTHGRSKSTTTPTVTGAYQGLEGLLKSTLEKRIAEGGLPREYELEGIRKANQTYDVIGKALENKMAAQGLLESPVAAAGKTRLESGRASDIVNMRMNLPILAQGLMDKNLGMAGDLISRFGLGSTTEGEQWGEMEGVEDTEQDTSSTSKGTTYGMQGPDPTSLLLGQMGGMAPTAQMNPLMSGANSMAQMLMQMYGMGAFGGGNKPAPKTSKGGGIWT